MTQLDNKTLTLIDELLSLGNSVLGTKHISKYSRDVVESGIHTEWLTRVSAFIERIFGRDSEYYRRISSGKMDESYYYSANYLFHHLRAIKSDVIAGALFNLSQVVEADVFDDILEQAEHLAHNGYYAPAAVVAGCVLEDALRRKCQHLGMELPATPKLESMNADLAKAGIYQKLIQKRITALADIRNSAAHGKWDDFTNSDVEAMLRDVRDFVTRYFT